jgi:hypothetical protein
VPCLVSGNREGDNHSLSVQDQPRWPDCVVRIYHDFVIFQVRTPLPKHLTKNNDHFSLVHRLRSAPDLPNRNHRRANQGRVVMIRFVRFADRDVVEEHHLVVEEQRFLE